MHPWIALLCRSFETDSRHYPVCRLVAIVPGCLVGRIAWFPVGGWARHSMFSMWLDDVSVCVSDVLISLVWI